VVADPADTGLAGLEGELLVVEHLLVVVGQQGLVVERDILLVLVLEGGLHTQEVLRLEGELHMQEERQ